LLPSAFPVGVQVNQRGFIEAPRLHSLSLSHHHYVGSWVSTVDDDVLPRFREVASFASEDLQDLLLVLFSFIHGSSSIPNSLLFTLVLPFIIYESRSAPVIMHLVASLFDMPNVSPLPPNGWFLSYYVFLSTDNHTFKINKGP
jgi:hypothetical protein